MIPSSEARVLAFFEKALEQPPEQRQAWLEEQDLPEAVLTRVQRLLERESTLGDFLETPAAMPEPDDFPDVGERLGSYQLERRIDSGGMGVVYLARRADAVYEQEVAIKLIRPMHLGVGAGFREQIVQRFEQERTLLARLQHPYIARILDGGSTEAGFPWLAMEYVDGVSLLEHADARKLGVRERATLFGKVCEGVQEAHRNLIVHRDLKPENILVNIDGEPKLLDFGIAHALGQDGSLSEAVASLTAMTPAYASPEQVRRQPLTTSSDVYSLGVVLYQLLTARRPYETESLSPSQAERVVCDTRAPTLQDALAASELPDAERQRRRRHLDRDLEAIVARAMHKDPAQRYHSAQELAADVRLWLEHKPVRAHPDSARYRLGKFIGRHRLGTAAAAVALLAVLGAAGIAFWQAGQARQAAADASAINAFLLDVLKMSDPFDAGVEPTLSQALDDAATTIDQRFAGRPDLSSVIRFSIGYSMLSRYRLQAADDQLHRALAESRSAFGEDDIRTTRILEAIAFLRQEQGRFEEAAAAFEDVVARLERNGHTADPLYGIVLGNLGNLHLVREDYPEAERWLQRTAAHAAEQGDAFPAADRATLTANLAQAAHGLEDLERADALYADAQAQLSKLYPEGNPDLAILLNNRALLAEEMGDRAHALALHRESLAERRRVFKHDHPMTVTAMTQVVRLSLENGESEGTLALANEAAAMADRVYTEPNARHASAYATAAVARLSAGDRSGAASAMDRAQTLLAAVAEPQPSILGYIDRSRATLCAAGVTPASGCPAPADPSQPTAP